MINKSFTVVTKDEAESKVCDITIHIENEDIKEILNALSETSSGFGEKLIYTGIKGVILFPKGKELAVNKGTDALISWLNKKLDELEKDYKVTALMIDEK